MSELKEKTTSEIKGKEVIITDTKPTAAPAIQRNDSRNSSWNNRNSGSANQKKRSRKPGTKSKDEFDRTIVAIRRVSRAYKGGKRMRLSVMLVIGDKKGKVGVGTGKGADVKAAEEKAYSQAKKNMIEVKLKGRTIPHEITHKYKAAKIFMKPAAPGTGVIAGGALRAVFEMLGVKDVLTKVLGTNNNITNVYATIDALDSFITK